ncbi:MAG TPA: methyltransferase domain-containing protein [Bacteroidota bacterium]|nr:methyltransferase domain-containing protein [Bacteroidota bacterium]
MLYLYGLGIGLRSILKGRLDRENIKNLVVPVNYWRTLEFRLAHAALQITRADRVLDIGSPKLFSLYLSDRIGAEVFSTDIDEYFVKSYSAYRELKGIDERRFHVMAIDGRDLPFDEGYFTKIFSISVLEHIPDDGDATCASEIGRSLARGGICVITVPFSPTGAVEYKFPRQFYWASKVQEKINEGKVFYQRRYSEKDLYERIVGPSSLTVEKILYMGERFALSRRKELSEYFHPLLGPLHPALSYLFHSAPMPSWRGMRRPLGALLVLRKA